MAAEITYIVREREDPAADRAARRQRRLAAGRELADRRYRNGLRRYFMAVGAARIGIVVDQEDGRKCLRSDPAETRRNELLGLPEARAASTSTPEVDAGR